MVLERRCQGSVTRDQGESALLRSPIDAPLRRACKTTTDSTKVATHCRGFRRDVANGGFSLVMSRARWHDLMWLLDFSVSYLEQAQASVSPRYHAGTVSAALGRSLPSS